MPLAPGPFLQAPQSDVTFAKVDYGFAAEAENDLGGIDALEASIDTEMIGLVIFAGGVDDPLADAGLDLAIQNFNALDPDAAVPDLVGIPAAAAGFETQLTAAIAAAPAAAWNPTLKVFVPPTPTPIHTPVIPAGAYTTLVPNPATFSASIPGAAGVAISNMTRVGSSTFNVGDQIQVNVKGTPGGVITFDGVLNGVDLGTSSFGTLNSFGQFAWIGTIDADQVGAWVETWYVDDVPIGQLNFIVLSAG